MISFKKFISEQSEATTIFQKAKKIATYIEYPAYRQRFIDAIDALSSAAEKQEIYNARFVDYKMPFNRGIEYAYQKLFDKIRDEVKKTGQDTSDLWGISGANEITKVAKIYDKMPTKIKEAIDFMDAIRGIPAALKIVKGYVKAGKPPAEPKPGQFVKPAAAYGSNKLALQFMKEATDSFKQELLADITNQLMTAYNKMKDSKVPSDLPIDPASKSVSSTIFMVKNKDGKKVLELISGSSDRVKKLIDDTVRDIVDSFVTKNASKLALILQKKEAPKEHKIIRTNIRNGMVENVMKFKFNDGSEFTLESSVIYKYSKTGRLFFQYPTRFKNVKLADGSMMKMPSEEKMIKEF
jgi:hypothetical protein